MANVVVIGAQWGDEGKGKIVDWLSQRADVVVRFQGGHNAGHTLVIGNVEYRLSLLPSGVVRPDKLSIIGNGVVVDPWALLKEIDAIRDKGVVVTPDRLKIAENAALILPSHGQIDRAREELRVAEIVWHRLDEARRAGRRILFEGAQGVMLDVDHGTYPYVTSSNTHPGQAAAGAGIGPMTVGYVLGITKAYTTRVGSGPFPTELTDKTGALLGERGKELGVVTGRKRRCGWLDAVMVRQAVQVAGITGIALTKLDVLDGFPEIKVCTAYRWRGETLHHLPASTAAQAELKPVYETVEGWSESTRGARSWAQLNALAIKYIRRIEELIEAPVALFSTSPERDDTVLVRDPFEDRL